MTDWHAAKTPVEDHIRSLVDDLRIPGVRLQVDGMDLCWTRSIGTPEVLHAIADRLSGVAQGAQHPTNLTDELVDASLSEYWDVSPRAWNETQRVGMRKAILTALGVSLSPLKREPCPGCLMVVDHEYYR